MSDVGGDSQHGQLPIGLLWDRFWFSPGSVQSAARVRAMLCVLTAIYFVGCWPDITQWLVGNAPFSASRTSEFIQTAGLENDARWMVSPLFVIDRLVGGQAIIYRAYLLIGIGLCAGVAMGRGGQIATWGLWLVFVGWANRLVLLAGLTEILLSFGLFAAAIAPPASAWDPEKSDWKAGFSLGLQATQITLFAVCTVATMLAGNVWWNGLGSFALAAPVEDRTFAFGQAASVLTSPLVYDSLTHLLVIALPIGISLAWLRPRSWVGLAIVFGWCAAVAMLGSLWLYGLTFACMSLAIREKRVEG